MSVSLMCDISNYSFLYKESRPPQYVPNSILKFCQHVDANCKLMHFSTLDGIL